jgi:hypothetical protein
MTDDILIRWLDHPEDDNFPAALSYLSLLFAPDKAALLVDHLRTAAPSRFKAKDIFRASGLSLLGVSNYHVQKDQKKIRNGTALSPLLLVRNTGRNVIVADGYHRLCAVYSFDEDAWIPCRIVGSND